MADIHKSTRYFIKDEEELNKETIKKLNKQGLDTTVGSIVNLFSNTINSTIADAYKNLTSLHLNNFISTADKVHLIDMAKKNGIELKGNESDDEIRYRICTSLEYNSGCNYTSIKQFLLSKHPTLYDVKIKNYTQGAGSCTVYLFSNEEDPDELNSAIKNVAAKLPAGINTKIEYPKKTFVELKVKIITDASSLIDAIDIKKSVVKTLEDLFKKSSEENPIFHRDIINSIIASNKDIKKAIILSSCIDGNNFNLIQLSPSISEKILLSKDSEIII
ncbi:MAG: hypothetical protein ACRDBY_09490 [Cetobacterium sp.]